MKFKPGDKVTVRCAVTSSYRNGELVSGDVATAYDGRPYLLVTTGTYGGHPVHEMVWEEDIISGWQPEPEPTPLEKVTASLKSDPLVQARDVVLARVFAPEAEKPTWDKAVITSGVIPPPVPAAAPAESPMARAVRWLKEAEAEQKLKPLPDPFDWKPLRPVFSSNGEEWNASAKPVWNAKYRIGESVMFFDPCWSVGGK